jgi:hypothetical protein
MKLFRLNIAIPPGSDTDRIFGKSKIFWIFFSAVADSRRMGQNIFWSAAFREFDGMSLWKLRCEVLKVLLKEFSKKLQKEL